MPLSQTKRGRGLALAAFATVLPLGRRNEQGTYEWLECFSWVPTLAFMLFRKPVGMEGVHRLVFADLLHHPRILLRRELPQERAYLRLFTLFLASPSEWTRYIAAWHSRIFRTPNILPGREFPQTGSHTLDYTADCSR